MNSDICPYCGNKALEAAARCLRCGNFPKTQGEWIVTFREPRDRGKKNFNIGGLIEFIAVLLVSSAVVSYLTGYDNPVQYVAHLLDKTIQMLLLLADRLREMFQSY